MYLTPISEAEGRLKANFYLLYLCKYFFDIPNKDAVSHMLCDEGATKLCASSPSFEVTIQEIKKKTQHIHLMVY